MSSLYKLFLCLLLLIFIFAGCSRSDVTESSKDSRAVGYPSENPSTESPQGETPPPGEGTPPPEEGTPPPEEGTPPPVTKGGSGLFYTPEELKIWNQRRLNGPYKTNWDNRIYHNAQLFMNGQEDTAPWSGQTSRSCWPVMGPYTDRYQGRSANDAGFVYRVLKHAGDSGATPYFNKVRSYLLAHTTVPGINFADGSRWCESSISGQGVIMIIATWARRLAITYSWIKEDMKPVDRTRFETWLVNAGKFFVRQNEWHIGKSFSNRYNDKYNCDRAFCPGKRLNPLYDGGPAHYQIHDTWNNRGAAVASSVGIIGVVTGNKALKDKGVRFFKESLKYSIWPDGTHVDIIRTLPGRSNGFSYPLDYLGSMTTLADAMARQGDKSLYEYSTRDGMAGSESKPGQPAKSIKLVMRHFGGQVDQTIKKYPHGASHTPGNIINPKNTGGFGDGNYSDLYMILPNLYYKDDYIRSIYTRTAPGAWPIPSRTSGGWKIYQGDWGTYSDVEFMWAGLEGKTWPYS